MDRAINGDIFRDPIARAFHEAKKMYPQLKKEDLLFISGISNNMCPMCNGEIVLLDYDKDIVGCMQEHWNNEHIQRAYSNEKVEKE